MGGRSVHERTPTGWRQASAEHAGERRAVGVVFARRAARTVCRATAFGDARAIGALLVEPAERAALLCGKTSALEADVGGALSALVARGSLAEHLDTFSGMSRGGASDVVAVVVSCAWVRGTVSALRLQTDVAAPPGRTLAPRRAWMAHWKVSLSRSTHAWKPGPPTAHHGRACAALAIVRSLARRIRLERRDAYALPRLPATWRTAQSLPTVGGIQRGLATLSRPLPARAGQVTSAPTLSSEEPSGAGETIATLGKRPGERLAGFIVRHEAGCHVREIEVDELAPLGGRPELLDEVPHPTAGECEGGAPPGVDDIGKREDRMTRRPDA